MNRLSFMRPIAAAAVLGVVGLASTPSIIAKPTALPQVSARLVSDVAGIKAGESFRVGVHFAVAEGWHIYDKNPGDSGLPTTAKFVLPKGFKVGEVQYPAAKEFRAAGNIVTRGFEKEALLWASVRAPASLPDGAVLTVKAEANWLGCKDMCIPGSQKVALKLPVNDATLVASADANLFPGAAKESGVGCSGTGCPSGAGAAKAGSGCSTAGCASGATAATASASCPLSGCSSGALLAKADGGCPAGCSCAKCTAKAAAKAVGGCPAGCGCAKCTAKASTKGGCPASCACGKCATKDVAAGLAPNFALKDHSGRTFRLSDYKGKTVVLEWTNNTCPFVKPHYESGNIQKMAAEYAKKDVVWLTVDSSHFANAKATKKWVAKHDIKTPILLDADGKIGRLYEAKRTPHVYVIDPKGKIAYQGAIDDNPQGRKPATKNLLAPALDAVLAGAPVPQSKTAPYGCSVKYAAEGRDKTGKKAGKRS